MFRQQHNAIIKQEKEVTSVDLNNLIEDLYEYSNQFSLENMRFNRNKITAEYVEFDTYLNESETDAELISRLVERGYTLVEDSNLGCDAMLKIPRTKYNDEYGKYATKTSFNMQRNQYKKLIQEHTVTINWVEKNTNIILSNKDWMDGGLVKKIAIHLQANQRSLESVMPQSNKLKV